MRLLLDTNVFLEVLLAQAAAADAQQLLSAGAHELFMSDFSLHSIGLLLLRRRKVDVLRDFLRDTVLSGAITVLSLPARETGAVADAAEKFGLDFDDAYQYAAAGKHGLNIVSFDADFDRTPEGRRTPLQINRLISP